MVITHVERYGQHITVKQGCFKVDSYRYSNVVFLMFLLSPFCVFINLSEISEAYCRCGFYTYPVPLNNIDTLELKALQWVF